MSSPFPLPLLFTAWTFHSDGGSALGNTIEKAHAAGAKSVAVNWDDDVTGDHVAELRKAGLFVVAWGPCDGRPATIVKERIAGLAPDGIMPNVENDPQADAALAAIAAGAGAGLPRAIVTNYGGASTPAAIAKFAQAACTVAFVECYAAAGFPFNKVDLVLWQGTQYGWSSSSLVPLLGIYRGETPAAYIGLPPGPAFGLYTDEPATDDQLATWKALAETGPPPPPDPIPAIVARVESALRANTARQINAALEEIADHWLAAHAADPSSRISCTRRIAASYGGAGWIPGASPAIVAALDKNGL